MRYVDVVGQSLFYAFGLLIIFFATTHAPGDALEWVPFRLVWAELLLGPWQLVSAVVAWRTRKQGRAFYIAYAAVAMGWCVMLWILNSMNVFATTSGTTDKLLLVVGPWLIATVYYGWTWRRVRRVD